MNQGAYAALPFRLSAIGARYRAMRQVATAYQAVDALSLGITDRLAVIPALTCMNGSRPALIADWPDASTDRRLPLILVPIWCGVVRP